MNLTWVTKFQHVERPKICAGMKVRSLLVDLSLMQKLNVELLFQDVENENEVQIGFQLEQHFPMLEWFLEPNAQLHCEID